MHGLEWRVPLLIELDEIHRSCIIDPDLSDENVSTPRETMRQNGEGGNVKRGSSGRTQTHECAQVATLIHIVRSGENLETDAVVHE